MLLKWIKTDQLAATYRSGVDDELPPGEMMQLLEDISELYKEFEDNKEETGKEKAAGNKRARDQATCIRDASLVGQTYEGLQDMDENGSKRSRSSKNSTFDLTKMIDLASAQMELTPKKAELCERKLILSEEKLKLDSKRFTLEAEERKEERLQQTEERKEYRLQKIEDRKEERLQKIEDKKEDRLHQVEEKKK